MTISEPFWQSVRAQFPILFNQGTPLYYLDSGATTQSPQCVLDSLLHYYTHDRANIHRGVYSLSERSSEQYEAVREKVRNFLNGGSVKEFVFTKGTTESLNTIAEGFLRKKIIEEMAKKGRDTVCVTEMDHHANFIPWQRVAHECGAKFVVIPTTDEGELDQESLEKNINERVILFAFPHVSNVLGTVNPVSEITKRAREYGVITVIDGAQSVGHLRVDLREIDCDFYVFSGHKMYAPFGAGLLYINRRVHSQFSPYQVGGGIVTKVTREETGFQPLPTMLEAGTPSIGDVIALGEAISFLEKIGMDTIYEHEKWLTRYTLERLAEISSLRLYGAASERLGIFSFDLENIHPHDVATLLTSRGVAIRPGHSCAQPLMDRFDLTGLTRASLGCYNTQEDIDALIEGIHYTKEKIG